MRLKPLLAGTLALAWMLTLSTLPPLATLSASAQAAASPSAAVEKWKDEVLYLILTDRFYDGDRQNDRDVDRKNPYAYHGGDLEGIIQKLDDLKDLGVTTLWITPFNDNQHRPLDDKYWAYHGYWIQSFDKVDEHMGDEATLRRLVREAHARGLKVLFDVVVNHMGYDAPMAHDPRFTTWFHHNGSITDWDDPYQNENFDVVGLPDLNSENAQVLAYMEDVWGGWIRRTGVDGFRLDTVRHVPIPFWHDFNQKMHQIGGPGFFTVGEVSYHDARLVPPYLEKAGLDSSFDFPMFTAMQDVFGHGQSARKLSDALKLDRLYPDASMLSPFIDSHDETRFLTVAGGDERKLRLALAFLLTMRGIPMIDYGTEVGMQGGPDPDNRRDMTWGANPALRAYTRKLIHMHRALAPLRRGRMREVYVDDAVYAFTRELGPDGVLVVVNNADQPITRTLTIPTDSAIAHVKAYHNRMTPEYVRVSDRKVVLQLAPKEAKILVPVRL